MFRITLCLLTLCAAAVARAAENDPLAEETLRRAIQAAGGPRALERMKGPTMWMDRGTFHSLGKAVPFVGQYATKWPHWYRQEIEGAYTITVNGEQAWRSDTNGVQKLAGAQLKEQLGQVRAAWSERLFPLTEKAWRLRSIDGVEVAGRQTLGVRASHLKCRDLRFYFDKQSYLLLKLATKVVSPQHGPETVLSESYFSQHKSFGGGKVPSQVKIFYDKKLIVESETVDYKLGATLDPQHFVAPN
ncbi:MAG: hypothetical protein VX346_19350 [Planctomycetota bacterium]|nr:hypothetical protein [Planctomycetota bacterium]